MERRRLLLSLPLAALALAAALPARATLLVYEPFDYAPGTVLDNQPSHALGIAGNYRAIGTFLPFQEVIVEPPGLDGGSLQGAPASSGNRLTQATGLTAGGAIVDLGTDVSVLPGTAVYWSALFRLDDSSNGNRLANITFEDETTGDSILFGEPGVGVGGLRVSADTSATGGLLADGVDNAFVDQHVLLLVGRYVNGAAGGDDTLDLLVYDTADADVLPASFDPGDPNAEHAFHLGGLDVDLARIGRITFTIRGDDDNWIDELRIGTTYADVVPEPGSLLLLGTGLVGLAVVGRRPRASA